VPVSILQVKDLNYDKSISLFDLIIRRIEMTKEEKRARKAKAIADKIKAKAIKHADKVARKMRKKGKKVVVEIKEDVKVVIEKTANDIIQSF
jgi:hypothetical protein